MGMAVSGNLLGRKYGASGRQGLLIVEQHGFRSEISGRKGHMMVEKHSFNREINGRQMEDKWGTRGREVGDKDTS